MTLTILLLLGLFVAALVLFSTEWLPVDVTGLLLLSALMILGLATPSQAFSGFGSDTVLTLASLFILTKVLLRTGVIEWIGLALMRLAGKQPTQLVHTLIGAVAGISALTSNTATTAVFLPVVVGASRRAGMSASRVLMPLAFASILGGTMTLIGTSTNLVISGALPSMNQAPLGFFELAWVGVPICIVGLLYLFFIAPRLLPERETLTEAMRSYVAELTIDTTSPLAGKSLRETNLGRDYGLTVMAIQRGERLLYAPAADFRLQAEDILIVEGATESILAGTTHLGVFSRSERKLQQEWGAAAGEIRMVEALVMPNSPLLGKSLREAKMRERFGCSVLALHRRSKVMEQIGTLRLEMGDVLLLQGSSERLAGLGDQVAVLGDLTEARRDLSKAPLALILFLGAIGLGAFGILPLSVSVVVAVALCLATRLIGSQEAYSSIEWPVLILVACMLAFGGAFEQTGAADVLSNFLSGWLQPLGGLGLLAILFLLTVGLTQPMSNQAAALVMLPLAIGSASALGYDPRPFVIGVTIAASNSFITPLEPSCMLVYGPGRYRFSDFVRVGAGLTLISFLLSMLIIPLVWPLSRATVSY